MTDEEFGHWKQHDVTKLLFSKMKQEVEDKTLGLVWNSFEEPEIVKGYIRAYHNILNIQKEDLDG